MRFVKRKQKFLAVFFLLIIVSSILQPVATYALTTGPHQPEYTSYEQPGSTDMVNLLTGDFTFSLPILEVPGPEGNFSVPLTYNAGIGLEQEASWVGLGWTLNVGAITRQINQYPDDASGQVQRITNVNLDGVRGWTSAALGLGNIGWNTVQGSYGAISLLGIIQVGYDRNGISSGGVLGIGVGNGGMNFDFIQFSSGVMTIASLGIGSALEGGFTAAEAKLAATGAIENMAVGAALSAALPSQTPGVSPSAGYWAYNKKAEDQGLFHKDYWIWLDQTRVEDMYGIINLGSGPAARYTYSNYYIKTGTQAPYTYTPLLSDDLVSINGAAPTSANAFYATTYMAGNKLVEDATSDINYYIPPSTSYRDAQSTCLLASDNFNVKAPGISGSIRPYRFDVGSVSMPIASEAAHIRYSVLPFTPYKVPFIYEGSLSSNYLNHTGNSSSINFNFGLDYKFPISNNNIEVIYSPTTPDSNINYIGDFETYGTFTLSDNTTFGSPRVRADVSANYKIPQANHIEWLSNDEIISGNFINGFMDYFTTSSNPTRNDFRSTYPFNGTSTFGATSTTVTTDGKISLASSAIANFKVGSAVQLNYTIYNTLQDLQAAQNGIIVSPQFAKVINTDLTNNQIQIVLPSTLVQYIGKYSLFNVVLLDSPKQSGSIAGYSITGVNGLTYHFALPSYDYGYLTWIGDKTTPLTKFSTITRNDGFANTWLLTGITGPDFVDRNANGSIDETDWGYWVKFNYGNYTDNYQWKIPFSGSTIDPENSSLTRTSGYKQLYYLNSIETRSHVAIFIKDSRSDNQDATLSNGTLKLSEIALLKREDYNKLFTVYSQPNDAGTINTLWLAGNFYSTTGSNPAVGTFIIQNALKRIKFTYNYNLCAGTPNSTAPNGGKLTLSRLSVLGRNAAQVVPDYKFDYGYDPANTAQSPPPYTPNPNYNINNWDAWGMYNATGTSAYNTHSASSIDSNGSSWSMSRVTTPQGSTIDINYERDKYGSVSGMDNLSFGTNFNFSTYAVATQGFNSLLNISNVSGSLVVGDAVRISGTVSGTCAATSTLVTTSFSPVNAFITSIQNNPDFTSNIVLDSYFGGFSNCGVNAMQVFYTGNIQKVRASINGDGIRVGSIVLRDQNQTYKTRYLYTNDDGSCSGVIAQEPAYANTSGFDFNTLPDYPVTPIVYGKVSVLSGNLTTDTDYYTKYVYQFETPNTNMISLNNDRVQFNGVVPSSWNRITLLSLKNEVTNLTSKIGTLKSINVYGNANNVVSTTSMSYTNQLLNSGGVNQNQGYYSTGVIMHDRMAQDPSQTGSFFSRYKINRSTVIKYPYALQSVTTQKDGAITKIDNIAWDFISGQVVEKNTTSSLGLRTKTIIQPAYTVANSLYSRMGPKAYNDANKNMLGQSAAEYIYRLDASGNITTLISGQATTWNSVWNNYRDFNMLTKLYNEGPGSPQVNVWRKNKTFVYNGTYRDLQTDGGLQFNASNQFDFTQTTPNTNWQQTSEIIRYDHFSLPVESKNSITNIYSSTKTDFNNKFILASASNAGYSEFAYSGAEDGDNTSVFFGGEVARKSGSVVSTPVHTGFSSLAVSSGGYGYVFKSNTIQPNRTYKASVWTTDGTNGKLYYNNGTEVLPTPTISQPITLPNGTWYRLDIIIPAGNTSIEVGVKTASGTVYFDDFRFQPVDAAVTCNVYNPNTFNLEYVLNNNNTYTRYQYDDTGRLIKTYVESLKTGQTGEKLISETKYDYRRLHVDR